MKYITLLLIFGMSLVSTSHLSAQRDGQRRDGDKREQLEQMKIAYITKNMNMSTEDAQRFWPIYNQYQDELANLRQGGSRGDERLDIESMNDQEAKELYTQRIVREEQKLAITKAMVAELEQSFSSKQILNYLVAEERFKRQVLSNLKEKMKEKKKIEEKNK